ncbi:MAG: aldo/keto reductase [Thermoanaerobaculia bacterium]
MERRVLGATGMGVSILGFGGSEIGYEGATLRSVEALLGAALDQGLNVIDTAECYFESERLIGRAVSYRRSEFHLFTKCGHDQGLGLPEWTPRIIEASVERSLRMLRTDRVDLLQLHSCDEKVLRKGDVLEAVARLKEAGKTRFLGYSGDGEDALAAVRTGRFDTLQISISVADQEAIDLVLPEVRARGLGVIAKRPVANAAWRTGKRPAEAYHHPYWERLAKLDYPFLKAPLSASLGTALRFTLAVPGVATAIIGTKSPGRFEENASLVAAGPLPPETYEAIRARWKALAPKGWAGLI